MSSNSNLENLIKNILSPINEIRKASEQQLNCFYENMSISDLDNLLKQLNINISQDDNVKMYICILIKKYIEEKIIANQKDKEIFIEYFIKNKNNIINLILSNNLSIKLINMLIISLCDSLSLLQNKDNNDENIYLDNIYEIFTIFSKYYINKKQTQDIKATMQCLYICKKFLKFMKSVTVNQKLEKIIKDFYCIIIQDYNSIINNIINSNNIGNNVLLEILIYYLKLFKHSGDFIDVIYSDKILNNTYELNVFILNNLIKMDMSQNNNNSNKIIFDLIFLSNKIIILYISQVTTLSTETLLKFAEMFYIFIKEQNVFNYINNFLKKTENASEFMNKFLLDIINFFYELLQLCSIQEFSDLKIFGNGFTDNAIEVSDFFKNKFWNHEKFQNLIVFILKNYLAFKPEDIIKGLEEPEDFYLWFTTSDFFQYDIRGKAGLVCRIIYDIFRKEIKDIYASIENELYNLTEKEYNLLQNNQNLNDEQLNLKCAILSYYYYTDTHFRSKKLDKHKWYDQILLLQIDSNIIKRKKEIFSTFLIMYILTKINSYSSDSKIRYTIFLRIMNIFLCKDFDYLLLDLSSIDFIYDYIEEEMNDIELPKNILNEYIIKICKMLEVISSPDIYNKIIQTTNSLLRKVVDDQLNLNFPEIFPVLQKIWQNKYENNVSTSKTKISLIRSNLLKLIGLFVKKVGFFISYESTEVKDKNFYENYFNFIYQIIGYSLSINSAQSEFLCKEAFNLILFIQDDFFENTGLSIISNISELNNPIESFCYFPYFIKTYNYLDILLINLSNSNQYFILQFASIEQFISLSFSKEISNILEQINFVDKIIYIFDFYVNNYINEFNTYIFNIIEYIYYIIVYHSKININQKNKLNDYIYKLIQCKLSEDNFYNNIINILNNNNKETALSEEKNNLICIYLGIIQLANRYIFINASIYNIINNDINIFIANKIIFLSKFISKDYEIFNILQTTMIKNCIFNLMKLINNNDNNQVSKSLNDIYTNIGKSYFLHKNDKILNHWLFFFNKIYNDFYMSKCSADEYKLGYDWKKIFEKDVQQIDSINKDYKIKFLMLSSDTMYNNEE